MRYAGHAGSICRQIKPELLDPAGCGMEGVATGNARWVDSDLNEPSNLHRHSDARVEGCVDAALAGPGKA